MSTVLHLRKLYHLISNPFEPPTADRRKPEDIIIIGESHRDALDLITRSLQSTTESRLIILLGDWGAGKTAVIKRAIYELEQTLGEKLFAVNYRIPRRGIDFNEFVSQIAIEAYTEALRKSIAISNTIENTIKTWIKNLRELEEYSISRDEAIPILLNMLIEVVRQGRKLLIVIDQLENLQVPEKNYEEFPALLREIFDNVSKHGQVVIVLSAMTQRFLEIFEPSADIWRRFVRAGVEMKNLGRLKKDETILLFKTLLEKYREPEYREKYREEKSLEPFTVKAIMEIWRLANGIPGKIYDISCTIISNAARKGIERIDSTTVKYLSGEYRFEWIDAIERMPYIDIYTLVSKILEASRKLLDISYIQTDIITKENFQSFLRLRGDIRNEKTIENLINSWHRGANFLVYFQVNGRYKLSIVKVSEKMIRRDVIAYLHRALSLSIPIFMERPIAPIDTFIVLITGGRITSHASYEARGLEVAFGIKVREKIVDTTEPKSYGRIRALVEEIKELEEIYGDLYSVPSEELEKTRNEVQQVLRSLGIMF